MSTNTLDTKPSVGDGIAPRDAAGLLADFVHVLLPGDAPWPSGRTVGVQSLLALRLLEQKGKRDFARVAEALVTAGGPLASLDETARVRPGT